jgi:hypothetical protein
MGQDRTNAVQHNLVKPVPSPLPFAWAAITGTSWEDAMKLPRRKFLHLAAGAVALPAVSHIARAQAYPARPVRIIVGYAPATP